MALPVVDFGAIEAISREAVALYGTPVEFIEVGMSSGRMIKAVIYRDQRPEQLFHDVNSEPANCLLNPDDFVAPNRPPQQFDIVKVNVGGFVRMYNINSVHPVLAEAHLALYIADLRAN